MALPSRSIDRSICFLFGRFLTLAANVTERKAVDRGGAARRERHSHGRESPRADVAPDSGLGGPVTVYEQSRVSRDLLQTRDRPLRDPAEAPLPVGAIRRRRQAELRQAG